MAFGRSNNAAATDYGAPAATSTGKQYRPMILAANWLHWVSSIIVMSIAAYFIAHFSHNTHIIYWVTIVSAPKPPTCTIRTRVYVCVCVCVQAC